MKLLEYEAAIEAVLFACGTSVTLAALQRAIAQDEATTRLIIARLSDYYRENGRGLKIIELNGSYQLCTNEAYNIHIEKILEAPQKKSLTQPLIETLAIIAYKQPITKAAIEQIRGVNADHAVSRLVELGLVEETGRLDAPGRPMLFSTTEDFLRHFGLKGLLSLPDENLFIEIVPDK